MLSLRKPLLSKDGILPAQVASSDFCLKQKEFLWNHWESQGKQQQQKAAFPHTNPRPSCRTLGLWRTLFGHKQRQTWWAHHQESEGHFQNRPISSKWLNPPEKPVEMEDIINMFPMSTKAGLMGSEHSSKTRWWQGGWQAENTLAAFRRCSHP